jgi:hypothetical protein
MSNKDKEFLSINTGFLVKYEDISWHEVRHYHTEFLLAHISNIVEAGHQKQILPGNPLSIQGLRIFKIQ